MLLAESPHFLKIWVGSLTSVNQLTPLNASSDMRFYTMKTISRL